MKEIQYCSICGSTDCDIIHDENGDWVKPDEIRFCNNCKKEVSIQSRFVLSPYERTRQAVYATGNRWAIENFNATHN